MYCEIIKALNKTSHYLCRSDTVDKTDLLETFLAHGEANLPALIDNIMDHSEGTTQLIHLVLHIHVHVATKTCDLELTRKVQF